MRERERGPLYIYICHLLLRYYGFFMGDEIKRSFLEIAKHHYFCFCCSSCQLLALSVCYCLLTSSHTQILPSHTKLTSFSIFVPDGLNNFFDFCPRFVAFFVGERETPLFCVFWAFFVGFVRFFKEEKNFPIQNR